MNRYQAMNNAASLTIIGALIAGLAKILPDTDSIGVDFFLSHTDNLLLALFLVLYRVKMHLDDHKYFEDFEREPGRLKYIGLLLAAIIWVLIGFSALTIGKAQISASALAISFAISTIWIIVHLVELSRSTGEDGGKRRLIAALRHKWVITNSLYIIFLIMYFSGPPVINVSFHRWVFVALLFVVLIYDKFVSDPMN